MKNHDSRSTGGEMNRPDCYEFAMDFLGGPEAEDVESYVSKLERENAAQAERIKALEAHIQEAADRLKFEDEVTSNWHLAVLNKPTKD